MILIETIDDGDTTRRTSTSTATPSLTSRSPSPISAAKVEAPRTSPRHRAEPAARARDVRDWQGVKDVMPFWRCFFFDLGEHLGADLRNKTRGV